MKRTLAKIAVFVLVGAIVNVAVAWGSLFVFAPRFDALGGSIAEYRELRSTEITDLVTSFHRLPPISPRDFVVYGDEARFGWELSAASVSMDKEGGDLFYVRRARAGWPTLCLNGYWCVHNNDDWFNGGVEIPRRIYSLNGPYIQFLPLWPRPLAIAINTLFYAAMIWLLVVAPIKLRRFIRMKGQRCPACAYPIGTSPVCTECGVPVKEVTLTCTGNGRPADIESISS